MSDAKLTNMLVYGGVLLLKCMLALLVAGIWSGSVYGFREGEALAGQQKEIAGILTLIGYGLTTWLDSNRPRLGSEGLAADVKDLQKDGVSRQNMTVIRSEDLALIQSEAARIRRIKPLRNAAAADEALERAQRG